MARRTDAQLASLPLLVYASFIIVALAAHCFEQLKAVRARTVGAITLSYIALIIYTEAQDTFITTLDSSGREVFDGITVALPAIVFMAVAGITVYAARHYMKRASCQRQA